MPDEPAKPASSTTVLSYADRLGEAAKWAVGALAGVATVAVAKLGLDRLGKGEDIYRDNAFGGVAVFTLGVTALVAAVVWTSRSTRVTLDYIAGGAGSISLALRAFFRRNSYFLVGHNSVEAFRDRLNLLADRRAASLALGTQLTNAERAELNDLISARDVILATARSERAAAVNRLAVVVMALGSLAVTLGAGMFVHAVNRDDVLRSDRLTSEAELATGELLPSLPADALVVPGSSHAGLRGELSRLLGTECELDGIRAIVLEVASPPDDSLPEAVAGPASVMHVVTERTENCHTRDLWLPPTVISARPDASEASTNEGESEDGDESGAEEEAGQGD